MEVIIFGASGLIGGHLTEYCINCKNVSKIYVFGRKALDRIHPKLIQYKCDYETLDTVGDKIKGDIVFNCLGTTLKDAGSKEQQYQIDCLYPIAIAKIAANNGIKNMISVSSVGASTSGNFYLKTKFDMEDGITKAMNNNVYFLRPSLLLGDRKKVRLGEQIGQMIMPKFNFMLAGNMSIYKAIKASDVAKAMLALVTTTEKFPSLLHYNEIIRLSKDS